MDISKQLFIDGISNLNLTQGTFRFDLSSFGDTIKTDEGKTKSKLESHMTIIMTPQGFMQTYKAMQRFLKEVEDQGLISFGKHEQSVEGVKEEDIGEIGSKKIM